MNLVSAWLHLSTGKLPLPHHLRAIRLPNDPQRITVTWQNDALNSIGRDTDKLLMIPVSDGKYTSPIVTGAVRKQQSTIVDLPGENIKGIYLFFGAEERDLYSTDVWFMI